MPSAQPFGKVVAVVALADCAIISDCRRINCSITLPRGPLLAPSEPLLAEALVDEEGTVIDILVPSA